MREPRECRAATHARVVYENELRKLFTGHGRHRPGGAPNPMFFVECAGAARLAQ